TRWLDVLKKGAYEKSFNAIDLAGELAPSGQAIKLWNDFVHDSLVRTTVSGGDKDVLAYASMDTKTLKLTVWLVNNHANEKRTSLRLKGYKGNRVATIHLYTGNAPDDTHPRITRVPELPILKRQGADGSLDCTMKPYSITTISLSPR
ncbi:hypothetical protein HQ560_13455, partial [bacterium]|nr:hypothetical protein [bacterium]